MEAPEKIHIARQDDEEWPFYWAEPGEPWDVEYLRADLHAARIEELERERNAAREWNRKMVEKAASGGVLDGYRELAAKAAEAEARADKLAALLKEAGEALREVRTYGVITHPAAALLARLPQDDA